MRPGSGFYVVNGVSLSRRDDGLRPVIRGLSVVWTKGGLPVHQSPFDFRVATRAA
jgi:hypothetical protein